MGVFIALLRGINVGGATSLAMADLKALCERLGFADVRTYIQSGNVIFESAWTEPWIKSAFEEALLAATGRPISVLVRSASEMKTARDQAPFPSAQPSKVSVVFLDATPAEDAFAGIVIPGREEIRPAGREIYIHYPDECGRERSEKSL